MERVILRHLKGSKASQLEEFPLQQFGELTIGRDPASGIRFDPDKDDLVGRQHARISRDPSDPYRFKLQDLNSRNGTFLNKLRVVGEMPLQPGDVIQLGAGGPELQFDIDPLPAVVRPEELAVLREARGLGLVGPEQRRVEHGRQRLGRGRGDEVLAGHEARRQVERGRGRAAVAAREHEGHGAGGQDEAEEDRPAAALQVESQVRPRVAHGAILRRRCPPWPSRRW